jgi:hypothetical protein
LDKIVEKLILYQWTIVKTPPNLAFITTDNPGFCYDSKTGGHNTKFNEGAFIFPLTPAHCLIIPDNTRDMHFYSDPTTKRIFDSALNEATVLRFINSTNRMGLNFINKLILGSSADTITRLLQKVSPR